MNTAYLLLVIVVVAALLFLLRYLYIRSMRIRNRLQMARVFLNISHELLTPLTVISASVERLREQEPRFATDYALMELNVERMTRLLQQMLETSKSQSGELKLLVSQGDVMEYIRQTAVCIEPLMHKNGLEFTISCTPQSMMGWIDTDKVDKIIYNLLSNAAKYTRTPGRVTLEAHTNDDYNRVIIRVSDTGIGISAEQRRRLYRRFHDGDYRRVKANGTGLGLALTHDLVYLHNGTIRCDSEEGQGTTFTVELPISKEQFNPAQIDKSHTIDLSTPRTSIIDLPALEKRNEELPTLKPATKPGEDAYHILVVEDNEDLLMLMQTLMSSKYHITTARNGREALAIVQREEPDLIVSDVMMPEIDGNELTRQLKGSEQWNHLPIILLTAKTGEESRKRSMRLGADDYINKPFRIGDLELRIDNLVENRRRILRERLSEMQDNGADDTQQPATADELFIGKAHDCVKAHLSDADFDRDAFAADMGLSASSLYNRLRALTGMNVSAFIRDIRMKEAKRLINTQPDLRVSDLAYSVGFRDPKYFATCFKKEFGIQPSEMLQAKWGEKALSGKSQ